MKTSRHSAFRSPLDDVLGTVANLRVLRALATGSRSQPELGRETGLSKPTVSRAIQALWELGLLTTRGVGEPTALKPDHPIVAAIVRLFAAERERVRLVYEELREAHAPDAVAIWVEGPAARGEDLPSDPLEVGVLVDSNAVDQARDLAEPAVAELEKRHAVMIDISYYTRADLVSATKERRAKLETALPLTGIRPSEFLKTPQPRKKQQTHAARDADGLERARLLVGMIKRDPTLVPRALAWVRDQLARAGPGRARSLREWERILVAASPAQLRQLLTEESERAVRLRQSNPFLPILPAAQRRTLERGATT